MTTFTKISTLLIIGVCSMLAIMASTPVRADSPARPANLATNGGFENWATPSTVSAPWPKLGSEGAPVDWTPEMETPLAKEDYGKITAGLYKDTAIKHTGDASVRLEGTNPAESVNAVRFVPVEPNTRYRVKLWVKGDSIEGTGIMVWAVFGPAGGDFWAHQDFHPKAPDVHTGTFDWEPVEYTVETNATAGTIRLVCQLRLATGKAWFDDFEFTKLGPVTAVQNF